MRGKRGSLTIVLHFGVCLSWVITQRSYFESRNRKRFRTVRPTWRRLAAFPAQPSAARAGDMGARSHRGGGHSSQRLHVNNSSRKKESVSRREDRQIPFCYSQLNSAPGARKWNKLDDKGIFLIPLAQVPHLYAAQQVGCRVSVTFLVFSTTLWTGIYLFMT